MWQQPDIPRGEELTQENIEDYVMPLEIDQRIVPGTAVTDRESLYGRIAVCDIGQGSVITGEMTEGKEQILGEMTEPVIAGFPGGRSVPGCGRCPARRGQNTYLLHR